MKYELVIKCGYFEYHFVFKKVQEAADFAEEFMKHMISCGDDKAERTTFVIKIEKSDSGKESEEN